jgi:hypothetical protein
LYGREVRGGGLCEGQEVGVRGRGLSGAGTGAALDAKPFKPHQYNNQFRRHLLVREVRLVFS